MKNTPLSARSLSRPSDASARVLTAAQLRTRGVPAAEAAARCRAGGPWQQLLPGVYLLHPGPPTGEELLRAALLYTGRRTAAADPDGFGEAMVTGAAALVLHGFGSPPPLSALDRVDVLVPRTRRLRSAGFVRIVRASHEFPEARVMASLPVAPVARALADAVAQPADPTSVHRLLAEAVRDGHCEPAAVVRELSRARLLSRPHVVDAVDALLAEGRTAAEERLYAMVRECGLPEPLWNVDLRLPGGPHLGGVDAYWPDQAVVVELDTRAPRQDDDAAWSQYTRKREHLERLGITVVHITPRKLREARDQQAIVVRTALMAAGDREPAAHVVVLPR
ncbi:hypothetical protein [Streptomyces roseolilacinus]|uniref:Transcriptional regulator, AbiEi antitoxin, Type IV TA system n=1 Tax=Streptomyces roseolilacinus TaxID=66904 RepID=A0A918B2V1_9ACTN|nr:hypothetical protein [Streptomyces roseolilacinus]GGQ20589.1 hypothetical protein GCM10010249_44070 [Streptomyces roseolilacinus]